MRISDWRSDVCSSDLGEVGQGAVAGYDFAVYPTRMQDALLPIGERIDSTIAQPGESDRYSFTLDAPARLLFDALSNPAGLNWTLTGPDGKQDRRTPWRDRVCQYV